MTHSENDTLTPDFFEKAGRFLSGEMGGEETRQFIGSENADGAKPEEIESLQRIWKISERVNKYRSVNVEKAALKVQKKIYNSKKENRRSFVFYLERAAAILFLPLLIASLTYYYVNKPATEQQFTYNEIDNAFGTVSKLTLPDGTKVWLNSGSHFRYPLLFSNKVRKVFLSGEAYFEVAHNKKKPFVVTTSDIDVMATGTVFNVMAYESEDDIEATLVSGKISMAKENGSSPVPEAIISVIPGQKATMNKGKRKITVQKADVAKIVSWKDGKLIFENDPMDVVIKKLDRWYNTNIVLVDPELKTYRYTATFAGETLMQVLELLKHSAPIEYTVLPRKKNANNTFTKGKIEIRIRDNYRNKHSKR